MRFRATLFKVGVPSKRPVGGAGVRAVISKRYARQLQKDFIGLPVWRAYDVAAPTLRMKHATRHAHDDSRIMGRVDRARVVRGEFRVYGEITDGTTSIEKGMGASYDILDANGPMTKSLFTIHRGNVIGFNVLPRANAAHGTDSEFILIR